MTAADPPQPGASPARYVALHWRGELPLATSLWLNWALPAALTSLGLAALAAWIAIGGTPTPTVGVALVVAWAAALALDVWGATGAWRAASAHASQGGRVVWAHAARSIVVLGLMLTAGSVALQLAPGFVADAAPEPGRDPVVGPASATLSAGGHRLRLSGTLGAGDAQRVQRVMAGADQVQLLELDSPGGNYPEALQVAAAVRARGWPVRVTGSCEGACTLIFMAGARRQVMPGARLGFQRIDAVTLNPLFRRWPRRWLADRYREAGLPQMFIVKTLSTPPPRTWYPDLDELVSAGVVTLPDRPLDVDLPAAQSAQPIDYADALNANPVWHALDRRVAGAAAMAAERMMGARSAGASDEDTLLAGQRVVELLLPKLLFDASPELREQFVALMALQLDAARHAGLRDCRGVLAGDTAQLRRLPAALASREADWLVDATQEPARSTGVRRPTATELEVVRRSLGDDAPARLAGLRRPAGADVRSCDGAAALIAGVMRLPGPQRRLAIRFIVEPS